MYSTAALVPSDDNAYLDLYVRVLDGPRGRPEVHVDTTWNPGDVVQSRPHLTFGSPHPDVRFECQSDSGNWVPCTSPHTFGPLGSGAHALAVRAVSVGGLAGPAQTVDVEVDATAPETNLVTAPPALTRSSKVSLAFASPDTSAHFECRVNVGPWVTCASPWVVGLGNGQHSLGVRAVDEARNVDSTPLNLTVSVDDVAPNTRLVGGPPKSSRDRTPSFRFATDDSTATFTCRMDAGPWRSCKSTWTSPKLKLGKHTLYVRAGDRAGNVDASPATRKFRLTT